VSPEPAAKDEPAKDVVPKKRPTKLGVFLAFLNGTLLGLYPVAIWMGLTYLSTRTVGILVLALVTPIAALRLRGADRTTFWSVLRIPLVIMSLIVLGIVLDDHRYVLAMPVLINLTLLITFGATLRAGAMPMIERFARMQDPKLSEAQAAHCRQFTQVWVGFFVFNGGLALLLGLLAPLAWWATYTGLIAYILMGVLFAFEYIVRKARFRDYGDSLRDRWLAKLLPPR
jgi:uncharacterized membrane protein